MSHVLRVTAALATALVVATGAVVAATGALGQNKPRSVGVHEVILNVGPGNVTTHETVHGYRLVLHMSPNRATRAGTIRVEASTNGRPLSGARVHATFTMLDMHMPEMTRALSQTQAGSYGNTAPILMFGRWSIRLVVLPPHAAPVSVRLLDTVGI